MALPVGSTAPDFSLKSKTADGLIDVTLGANLGVRPTVILFFPLAFTGVCTTEFCTVTEGLEHYSSLGASVIGISVDSPFAQEAWAKANKIQVTLASDLNKTVSKAYGVLLDDLVGIGSASARAAFVINKAGVIVHSEQTPSPKELPSFEKVLAALKAL